MKQKLPNSRYKPQNTKEIIKADFKKRIGRKKLSASKLQEKPSNNQKDINHSQNFNSIMQKASLLKSQLGLSESVNSSSSQMLKKLPTISSPSEQNSLVKAQSPNSKEFIDMYKNLKESAEKPQSPQKKKILMELMKSHMITSQDNITPKNGQKSEFPNFTQFVDFVKDLQTQHQKCGPNCKHLQRFYEKLGLEKRKNRSQVILSKSDIGSLPRISKHIYQV